MLFNMQCTGKKRQMVYVPDVNPASLLFFYERGNSGASWSLRDYSTPFRVIEKYARDFGCSADEIRRKARFSFDAPTVDTSDLAFWHEYTWIGNRQVLKSSPVPAITMASAAPSCQPPTRDQFPLLNSDAFHRLEKA